jgi:hypothetical protein
VNDIGLISNTNSAVGPVGSSCHPFIHFLDYGGYRIHLATRCTVGGKGTFVLAVFILSVGMVGVFSHGVLTSIDKRVMEIETSRKGTGKLEN